MKVRVKCPPTAISLGFCDRTLSCTYHDGFALLTKLICLQEGPHSTLPDDEFYDAVETGFDKMEEERCARVPAPEHTRDQVELPPPAVDNRLTVHPLWTEVNKNSSYENIPS